MVKSKKNNNSNVSNAQVDIRRSAIALAVLSMISAQAEATDGTTLPDTGEFSVDGAGTGFDSGGTIPTYTKVGDDVGVIALEGNAKAILKWENLGVANDQTLTFSGSHASASVILNKVTGSTATSFLGSVTASDNVDLIFVNDNGITIGTGASFGGVTDLLLSTNSTAVTDVDDLNSFSTITSETLTGGTNLTISTPVTVKSGGDIWLMADGTISGGTNKITAVDLVIDADGAVSIDTAVTNADLTSTGALDVADDDSLTIKNLSVSGTGTIDISAEGTITVSDSSFSSTSTGTMTLNADSQNDGGGAIVTSQVISNSGDISLEADSFTIGANINSGSSSNLTLIAASGATSTIGIGADATGTINIDATEAAYLQSDGDGTIVIGASGYSGAVDINAVTFGAATTIYGGATAIDGTVSFGSKALIIDTSDNSDKAITQSSGSLTAGATTLSTTAADISIGQTGNSLTSIVTNTTTSGDVSIGGSGGIALGASSVAGTLSATATTGNITDSGALTISGTSAFTTSADDADIALDVATNSFTGAISITSTDTNTNDGEDVTIVNATNTNLGTLSAVGTLAVTSTGAITDSGTLTVGSTTSFTTKNDTAKNITLNDGSSTFGSISLYSYETDGSTVNSGDISITENAAMSLAAVKTTGSLTASAGSNDIDIAGVIRADTAASLTATSSAITNSGGSADDDNYIKSDRITITAASIGTSAGNKDVNIDWRTSSASVGGADPLLDISAVTAGLYLSNIASANAQVMSYTNNDLSAPTVTTSTDSFSLADANTPTPTYADIETLDNKIGAGFDVTNTIAKYIANIINGYDTIGSTHTSFLTNSTTTSGLHLVGIDAGMDAISDITWTDEDSLSASALVASKIDNSTISSLVATTADINGGTIDGATIGANSATTIAATNVTVSGTLDVDGASTLDQVSINTTDGAFAVTADNASNFAGAVNITGALDVDGATTTDGITDSTTIAATNVTASGTLGVTGNTTVGGTLGVTGASTLTGNTTVGGTLAVTGTLSAATGSTIGNLTLANGSITDSSGAISFGNETLTTTGTLEAGATTVASLDAGSGTIQTTGVIQTDVTDVDSNAAAITAEAVTARAAEVANADAITAEAVTARAAEVANAAAITAEAVTARAAEVANAGAITVEATTARAAELKASTALSAILTDYGVTNTVKTAGIADSAVTLSKVGSVVSSSLTRVEAKVDALALFTTSTGGAISETGTGSDIAVTALKAIDVTNAKANTAALGDVETRVDVVEANGGNTFLSFIKRLFGGS